MKKSTKGVRVLGLVMVALALVALADFASATTLANQVATFNTGMTSYASLIMQGMFIAGIATGGMAAFKFKEHNENPQQVKLSKPLTYLLASGLLVGLPATVEMMGETVTGQAPNTGGIQGGIH